jgi:hypothetical protein
MGIGGREQRSDGTTSRGGASPSVDLAFAGPETGLKSFGLSHSAWQPFVLWTHDGGATWEAPRDFPPHPDALKLDPCICFSDLQAGVVVACRMLKDQMTVSYKFDYASGVGGRSWRIIDPSLAP